MVLKACNNSFVALTLFHVIGTSQAGPYDLCTRGSDTECTKFGSNMCCAHIEYVIGRESQDFYACTSKTSIEWSGSTIYDEYGYRGRWMCASAVAI